MAHHPPETGRELKRTPSDFVTIEDQGPRDGFQSLPITVPTALKLRVIRALAAAGLPRVQVCAFVRPDLVPQMADAAEVCADLSAPEATGVVHSALVLNERGVERAVTSGLKHVAASLSASDTHSRKNTGRGLVEMRGRIEAMVSRAKDGGLAVRGGVQCAFGCREEGAISPDQVMDQVSALLELGVDELALADSTGMGVPAQVADLAGAVVELAGDVPLALHLHDTEGRAMDNAIAALRVGVRRFDTAFGGLGGCPFIEGASGNLATEDLVGMLHQLGYRTGVDSVAVAKVSEFFEDHLGADLPPSTFTHRRYRSLRAPTLQVVR